MKNNNIKISKKNDVRRFEISYVDSSFNEKKKLIMRWKHAMCWCFSCFDVKRHKRTTTTWKTTTSKFQKRTTFVVLKYQTLTLRCKRMKIVDHAIETYDVLTFFHYLRLSGGTIAMATDNCCSCCNCWNNWNALNRNYKLRYLRWCDVAMLWCCDVDDICDVCDVCDACAMSAMRC